MTKSALFQQLLSAGTVILDGASGTQMQKAGMPAGVCPELWILEHPEVLARLQKQYLQAGSSILYAFTFGANRVKLARHLKPDDAPAGDPVETTNRDLAALSVRTRNAFIQANPKRTVLVAGDLAPTGQFLQPAGDLSFDTLIDIYRQQVRGQLAAGVDLFVAETMMDLAQVRAAVFAVQAECDLPVMVSMTVSENGRTLAGNAPQEGLITCSAMGAAAFGLNCSFGPERLAELMLPLLDISPIPLLIKPNAGLPRLLNGQTVFPMPAAAFARAMQRPAEEGIVLLGGCCGTGPDHIAALHDRFVSGGKSAKARCRPSDCGQWICSSRAHHLWSGLEDLPVVSAADLDGLTDRALDCLDDDPDAIIFDFTALAPAAADRLPDLLQELQLMLPLPFVFRCEQADTLAILLKYYHGRAGVQTRLPSACSGALLV